MTLSPRARITLAFSAGIALVLVALSAFVYVRTGSDLLDAVDAGLRSRADVLAAEIRTHGADVPDVEAPLIERDEAFAQVAGASGTILRSSRIVSATPLLDPGTIRSLDHPQLFDRTIPRIDNTTRVLAVPVERGGERFVLMVGSSLQDRADELLQLAATLGIGGVVALALLSLGGWVVVGSSLNRALARERRFVDEASHELRTPIAVLRGRLELALSRPRPPGELEDSARKALSDAEDLSRLADDLLVLSRSEDGRIPIQRERIALSELLEASATAHRPAASARDVRIEVDVSDGPAAVDPIRVRQVLDNLLDNAIRHAPSGGIVRLSAERRDGRLRIRVRDPGAGFDPDLLARAFEPFARGSGEAAGSGAGLGLAIVKAVAEAHGGDATAENLPGGGAQVTVTLRT